MEFAYDLSGGAPVARKYLAGNVATTYAAIASGVPVIAPDGGGGDTVQACTTTTGVNIAGLSVDSITAPVGVHDGSTDPARFLTIIINPDAVYRARLSGGATEGTALTALTVVTADTDGDDVLAGTTLDESAVWGYTGANAGAMRRMNTTAGNVHIAFRYDIAVGDTFLQAPLWPLSEQLFPQLTTNLTEVDASAAIDTDNDNFLCVELDGRDSSEDGNVNSYAYLKAIQHRLGSTATIA